MLSSLVVACAARARRTRRRRRDRRPGRTAVPIRRLAASRRLAHPRPAPRADGGPLATAAWQARSTSWCACGRPILAPSASVTASAMIRPCVRSRLARMRSASTASPARRCRIWTQRSGRQLHDLRQRVPLGLPAAQRALVFLRHRAQHGRDQPRHPLRRRQRRRAADRVALVRHGGRAAAPQGSRLRRFADFGLRQQRDIARDLAQAAGQQAEHGGGFGHPVALRVPRHVGQTQAEFRRQRRGHLQPLRSEAGQRAGGAAELQRQEARPQFPQTLLRGAASRPASRPPSGRR